MELLAPLVGGSERAAECYERYRMLRVQRGEATDSLAIYNAVMTDRQYRGSTRRLLDAREGAAGDTYAYLVEQRSPMFEGRLGAPHALDVPLGRATFTNVRGSAGRAARARRTARVGLHDRVDARLATAAPRRRSAGGPVERLHDGRLGQLRSRTGNPSTNALPGWPQYRADRPYTMVFGYPDVRTVTVAVQREREEEVRESSRSGSSAASTADYRWSPVSPENIHEVAGDSRRRRPWRG